MKWRLVFLPVLTMSAMAGPALAQPVDLPIPPAKTSEYPTGISVAENDAGPVYVNQQGQTLYGMDLRTVQRWAPDGVSYCSTRCSEWEPVLAPADSKPNIAYPRGFGPRRRAEQAKLAAKGYHAQPQKAPDWTVIEGPHGLQWVYKGWHMVYTRKGDQQGSTQHDGASNFIWNTLKFVPQVPQIVAPSNVEPVFSDGQYALSRGGENLLFSGSCKADCGQWEPLAAGMASRGMGDWQVSRKGDVPQWTYRGEPVFVGPVAGSADVPASARILRP